MGVSSAFWLLSNEVAGGLRRTYLLVVTATRILIWGQGLKWYEEVIVDHRPVGPECWFVQHIYISSSLVPFLATSEIQCKPHGCFTRIVYYSLIGLVRRGSNAHLYDLWGVLCWDTH